MVEADSFLETASVPMATGLPEEVAINGLIDVLKVGPVTPGIWLLPLPPIWADPIVGLSGLPTDPSEVGNDRRDRTCNRSPDDPAAGRIRDDDAPGSVPALPEGPTKAWFVMPNSQPPPD